MLCVRRSRDGAALQRSMPVENALDRTTGATFARSQEVQPLLGAAVKRR